MFNIKYRFAYLLLLYCFYGFYTSAFSQESVDVPQLLQKDVHAFKLTIDSLKSLTQGLQARASDVLQELQILQQKMALVKQGSRNYRLERRRYEEKLSDYMSQKYTTLNEMQSQRLRTLASLEGIISNLQRNNHPGTNALQVQIEKQIRLNDDRMTHVKLEMLRILNELKKHDLSEGKRESLNKNYHQLRGDRLALYEQSAARLSLLQHSAGEQDQELPGVLQSLIVMRETLRDGFDWIETEMAYIGLYAEHRKNRLAIDANLLELTGLVERFNDFVTQINANSDLLLQVEYFDQQLNAATNGRNLLPGISRLKWPGQPDALPDGKSLSQTEIDSLRNVLKKQLKK